ncbi:hypothetical protein V5F53_21885, partial [Xanthobacter sp. V4C-4]|uniref:hypothetical protein n=1 Tax=Xanthobacter cornucopiae TaxID=3119924 RepID=UPI0037294500
MGTRSPCRRFITVMAGFVPAIHTGKLGAIFGGYLKRFGVDTRDKPGHDRRVYGYVLLNFQTGS